MRVPVVFVVVMPYACSPEPHVGAREHGVSSSVTTPHPSEWPGGATDHYPAGARHHGHARHACDALEVTFGLSMITVVSKETTGPANARKNVSTRRSVDQNQVSTLLRAGTPPAWTTWPSITTPGVDITP